MKLNFDIKYDHTWHLFFRASCSWLPMYPPPDAKKDVRKLKHLLHHNGCKLQLPTNKTGEFIADLWFDKLDNDDCVYEMMKYVRRTYNSMSFGAQLTLEDVEPDPRWEFPMSYWHWNDFPAMNRCREYPDFIQTFISPEEAEVLLRFVDMNELYSVAIAILDCRAKQLPAGGRRITITNCLENNWSEQLFKRQ